MTDGEPFWLVYGNRTKPTGRFASTFSRHKHRWITRTVDSRKARMTNKKLIAQWAEEYGEDSDFFRVRVRGLPPRVSSMQFFATDAVEAAMAREVNVTPDDPIVLAVDVARFGDDRTVIRERRGFDCRTWPKQVLRGADVATVIDMVAERANTIKLQMGRLPDAINVDGVGVGGGVVDGLRRLHFPG